MPYEWKVERSGHRRYVRTQGDTRIERITETPKGAEMAIEPPAEPVAAEVESDEVVPVAETEAAPVAVPTTKAPTKRRGTRKKKSS